MDFDTQGFVTEARTQGYSWDEINTHLNGFREEALKQGHPPDEVDKFLGYKADSNLESRLRKHAETLLSTTAENLKPETSGKFDAFLTGLEASSSGLLARGDMPSKQMPQDPDMATRIAHSAGVMVGDIPFMVAGALGGGIAGTAVSPGAGTVVGGGAGAMALPELIRGEYIEALQHGEISGPRDFAVRQAGVWWNTIKQATVGGLTAGTGKYVGGTLEAAGAGAVTTMAGSTAAELGVMTTSAAVLEGRLPRPEEFVDGAVLLVGFKAAMAPVHLVQGAAERSAVEVRQREQMSALKTIRENLQRHWAATGESPMDAVSHAMEDPAFRNKIVSPPPPDAPKGSSSSPTDIYGDFVVARDPDQPIPTGRELPNGMRLNIEPAATDGEGRPIEHAVSLVDKDGGQIHTAKLTQLDEKMWDIGAFESPLPESQTGLARTIEEMKAAQGPEPSFEPATPGLRRMAGEMLEAAPDREKTDVAFIANLAKRSEDQGGRLMTGLQKDRLPNAILHRLDAAGLLEEVKTGKGVIYQIHSTKEPPDQGVRPVSGNSPSIGLPHSELAMTGDANVDAVINRPKVKAAIDNPKVDRTRDVPDYAGASGPADDLSTHLDRHIPRQVTLNGVTFDPAVPLNIHEQVERSKMEELIPQFVKETMASREPGVEPMTPEERATIRQEAEKKAYKIAHEEYATLAEHSWLRSHNIPVDKYEALFKEWGKSINSYDPKNLPDDLYMVNKHGPADLGPQAIVAGGTTTGASGTSSVVKPAPSPRISLAIANPFTGTIDEARSDILGRMADLRVGPSIWQRIKDNWFKLYREMFRPDHPINQATDAIEQGGSLTDATNPDFAYRLSELSPNLAQYAVRKKMIDFSGNVTGPGLDEIMNRFPGVEQTRRFWAYAISRWAIEKGQQNKETGVDLSRAHMLVDYEHQGGTVVPGEDVRAQAARIGVKVFDHPPGTHPDTDTNGPHYNVRDKEVHMLPPGDPFYAKAGLDYDVVLAHEVGHAAAYSLGRGRGKFNPKNVTPDDLEALRQELTIHSRRFKPEFWEGFMKSSQAGHIRKSSELLADAFATWMTEPGARARMPVFQSILAKEGMIGGKNVRAELDKFGIVPPKLGTEISRSFEDLVDWQNQTLQWLRDGGILNGEQYLKLVAENQARIPGYREPQVQTREGKVKGPGPGLTAYDPVKEFFGSQSKIEDIQKSLLQDAFLRMQLATRNRANLILTEQLEPLQLASKVRDPALKLNLSFDELKKILDLSTNDAQTRSLLNEPSNFGIWRFLDHQARPDEVPVFRDGKFEKWKFEDEHLTRYLKGLDQVSMGVWQKIMSAFTKVQRAGIVLNPAFPVRLATYDIPWQFITKPEMRNSFSTFLVGLRHVVTNSSVYDQWLRSGGAERVFDGLTKNEFIKDNLQDQHTDPSFLDGVTNVITTPYHALRAWAQILNQAQRVGRFAQGVKEGEGTLRAGMASSEYAFHRAGFGGPVLRGVNSGIPFFAAYLNSLEQTFRAQFGIGHTLIRQQFNPLRFTAAAAAVITLPMLAMWARDKDKEWYKAAPDWQKDNGLLFHFGPDDAGHTLFLKYPPLISYLYGGLPRRLMEQFTADAPSYGGDKVFKSALASAMPPGGLISYNVLLPIVEKLANYSFFRDQPLVPEDVKKQFSPYNQFNKYSTETAKYIAKFFSETPVLNGAHLSPPEIDNFVQGWTGTLGDAAIRAVELALQKSGTIKMDAPETKFPEDYPIFKSFFARYPSSSAQPIKDFLDRMTKYQQTHGDLIKAMTAGDFGEFQKVLGQNPTSGAFHSFKMRQPNGALSQLNNPGEVSRYSDALRTAQSNGDQSAAKTVVLTERALQKQRQTAIMIERMKVGPQVSANDKRQLLDTLYAQMQTEAENALKVMDRAGMK